MKYEIVYSFEVDEVINPFEIHKEIAKLCERLAEESGGKIIGVPNVSVMVGG